ncbi:MAG: ABC-2 family transporter protein [Candidatus Falkowbacteria bacterium]
MGKYWVIMKNRVRSGFAYRANTITTIISESFSFGVLFYIWFSIYKVGGQIGDYSFAFMIFYYAIGKITGLLIEFYGVAWNLAEAISEGEFTNYLLKPVSIIKQELFIYFGNFIYNLAVFSVIILAMLFYIIKQFGYLKLSAFFLLSVNSAFIFFFIFFLIGAMAFFFQRIQGLSFLLSLVSIFLAGKYVPLDVLPGVFYKIAGILPFQYISFIPIMVFKGEFDSIWVLRQYAAGLAWILVLYVLTKIVLAKGIKKYEAIGI